MRSFRSALILAAAAAVLFLGAGCPKSSATPIAPASDTSVPIDDARGGGDADEPASPPQQPTPAPAPAPAASPPPPTSPPATATAAIAPPSKPPAAARPVAPATPAATPPATPASTAAAQPTSPPPPVPATETAPPAAAEPAPPAPPTPTIIRVTAQRFTFSPNPIRLRRGEPVVLEVVSPDVTHGFLVPNLNINRAIEPGKTESIAFTPSNAGTFEVICSVFCGDGHSSMRGMIIVE